MPVNTIASPAWSAAAITSSSRIEPPGWITAVAPASTARHQAIGKGKKGVGRHGGADRASFGPARLCGGILCLPRGDPRRLQPVHLPRADARGRAILGIDDCVSI